MPLLIWLHSWISIPAHGGHFWDRATDGNFGWSFPAAYLNSIIGFSLFWFVISFVAGTAIQIMTQQAQLDASTHKIPDLGRSWATVKEIGWRMLGLYIAMGAIIGIGFVLLIIPGLFAIRRYLLAPYVMLDKKCGIKEALDKSAEMSLINPGSVWGIIGVLILISLVGILPLIGSLAAFVLGVLYSVAPALRYQQLKKLL